MSSAGASNNSIVKRIREHNSKYIPLLKQNVDIDDYVSTVIKEENSELYCNELSSYIIDINDEIKTFITKNKTQLLSGMQGFSLLVDKYNGLSSTSSQLKRDVCRIEGDIHSREKVLKAKFNELQNIHTTSIMIRKLRQFLHVKIQIDNLIKASLGTNPKESGDVNAVVTSSVISKLGIRQLGTISKLIHEAETCLGVDTGSIEGEDHGVYTNNSNSILSIILVQKGYSDIQEYARQLRVYTKTSLLSSIRDKNQSVIAACLQIFYNLKSLPSAIMAVVESLVEETVSSLSGSTASVTGSAPLELRTLLKDFPELLFNNSSHANPHITNAHRKALGAKIADLTFSLTSIGNVGTTAAGNASVVVNTPATSGAANLDSHTTKLRIAAKEIAHMWTQVLHEQYLQVYCLQQVLHKKVDPTNKLKFSTLLAQLVQPVVLERRTKASGQVAEARLFANEPIAELIHLCNCELIPLYCSKLSDTLKTIFEEKVTEFPIGCVRLYPSIRGALACSLGFIPELAKRSREYEDSRGHSNTGGIHTAGGPARFQPYNEIADDDDDDDEDGEQDLFGVQTFHNVQSRLRLVEQGHSTLSSAGVGTNALSDDTSNSADSVGTAKLYAEPTPLLVGLNGLRDLYLDGAYTRLIAPIHQMFPEMAGYNAAVPSKRDLTIYFQAVVAEYSAVLQECQIQTVAPLGADAGTSGSGYSRRGVTGLDVGVGASSQHGGGAVVRVTDETVLLHNLNVVVLKSIYYYCEKVQRLVVYNQASTAGVHAAANQSNSNTSKPGAAGGKTASARVDIYRVSPLVQSTTAGPYTVVGFQKHASVEHNSLLIKLLLQTITNLENLYETIGKATAGASTGFSKVFSASQPTIRHGIERFSRVVREFAVAELLSPLVDGVCYYIRNTVLMPLLSQYDKPAGSGNNNADGTSPAIEVLTMQFPELLNTFIFAGSADPGATSITNAIAVREIVLRTINSFITIAALSRRRRDQAAVTGVDNSELFERQCINDCTAIDLLVTSHCSNWKHAIDRSAGTTTGTVSLGDKTGANVNVNANTGGSESADRNLLHKYNEVALEFMAFQELLLVHSHTKDSTVATYTTNIKTYLTNNSVSYNFQYLRPSTLLHYLISISPSQLPSPYAAATGSANANLVAYVEQLTTFTAGSVGTETAAPESAVGHFSLVEYNHSKFAQPLVYTFSTVLKYYPAYSRPSWIAHSSNDPPYACWKDNSVEATMVWRVIQQCLDTYMQRIVAVSSAASTQSTPVSGVSDISPAEYKQSMRNWYELILGMGDVALLSIRN